ncbi:MAG: hypothetical protein KC619_13890 [Myxococcales bacterium]|nr:hypothetical protein [Myxococcales bacterium]
MTLPVSRSRPIDVDGIPYRWSVAAVGGSGHALLAESAGRVSVAVELVREVEGMFWLYTAGRWHVGPVTVHWVRAFLELAQNAGWSPAPGGSTTWFRMGPSGLQRLG